MWVAAVWDLTGYASPSPPPRSPPRPVFYSSPGPFPPLPPLLPMQPGNSTNSCSSCSTTTLPALHPSMLIETSALALPSFPTYMSHPSFPPEHAAILSTATAESSRFCEEGVGGGGVGSRQRTPAGNKGGQMEGWRSAARKNGSG